MVKQKTKYGDKISQLRWSRQAAFGEQVVDMTSMHGEEGDGGKTTAETELMQKTQLVIKSN